MKKAVKRQRHGSHIVIACALGLMNSPMVAADEMDDMKAQMRALQARMDQMEMARIATTPSTQTEKSDSPSKVGTPLALPSGLDLTIYGRGDIGYTSSNGKNSAGQTVVNHRFSQGEMASRLGISGAWTFDPELKAIFGAELGLNFFNGNAGGGVQNYNNVTGTQPTSVLFNRGTTVGLSSSRFGSFEGGVMYMAPFWVAWNADRASANNYGYSDFSALATVFRPEPLAKYLKDPVSGNVSGSNSLTGGNSGTALFYSNAARYRTPTFFDGLTGELSVSNGQQVANTTSSIKDDGRTWAGNIQYNKGPIYVGYGHMDFLQKNDTATTGNSNWQTRNQMTDIVGARYKWNDLTIGGAYTIFRVTNAGGYRATAYGLSAAYDLTAKHRIESSLGRITYSGANSKGAFGTNLGDGKGDPVTTAASIGYIYNMARGLSAYAYYTKVYNNEHAKLGTNSFRGDTSSFGYNPSEWTLGMFYVF